MIAELAFCLCKPEITSNKVTHRKTVSRLATENEMLKNQLKEQANLMRSLILENERMKTKMIMAERAYRWN